MRAELNSKEDGGSLAIQEKRFGILFAVAKNLRFGRIVAGTDIGAEAPFSPVPAFPPVGKLCDSNCNHL
jgi:hypothetical protein